MVTSSRTSIRNVLQGGGSKFDTSSIDWLSIYNLGTVKYVPAGIKKNFPHLTKFEIINGRLIHLEREDMRQFGDSLMYLNFNGNSLTAIEGNLFEFNPNLRIIYLNNNPFKFINVDLFMNFRKMNFLTTDVSFGSSNCINSYIPVRESSVNWNIGSCNDIDAKNKGLMIILDRKDFFKKFFNL